MDIDFASLTLSIRRGVVRKYVGDLKTRASHRLLPLHEELADALGQHRAASEDSALGVTQLTEVLFEKQAVLKAGPLRRGWPLR
jgi:hypothetical protein